jgi:hypothetical protein
MSEAMFLSFVVGGAICVLAGFIAGVLIGIKIGGEE